MGLHVGSLAEITTVIRDRDGALTAPDTLAVDILAPSATDATVYTLGTDSELTTVEAGVYRLAITVDESGAWKYRWRTTGDVQDVGPGELWVTPTDFDTEPTTGTTPTVQETALLLRDHTTDDNGRPLLTFTAATTPSAAEAVRAIDRARTIVLAHLGPAIESATQDARDLCRVVIAHRAAMALCLYLPTPEPEYDRLRLEFDGLMDALQRVVSGSTATTAVWASIPVTTPTAQYGQAATNET